MESNFSREHPPRLPVLVLKILTVAIDIEIEFEAVFLISINDFRLLNYLFKEVPYE